MENQTIGGDRKVFSLSPSAMDRKKLSNLMQKYTYKSPNMRRFRSPVAQNLVKEPIDPNVENSHLHHFDLDRARRRIKANFCVPKKLLKPETTMRNIMLDSSFTQASKKRSGHKKNTNLSELISDLEIETMRTKIWQNIKMHKPNTKFEL